MIGRAARLRCPNCGGGPLYSRWLKSAKRCPSCGLGLERGESGYGVGALWFNLMFAEAFTTLTFLTVVLSTWPSPPWHILQYSGPLEALITPFIFYPFSKNLFLAFDLCFRPPTRADFEKAKHS